MPGLAESPFVRLRRLVRGVVFAALAASSTPVWSAEANVAVAANFAEPAKEIARLFEERTGHKAVLSFGATGGFYTQITQGAPFAVFLSADQSTPKKLAAEGLAAADSLFTYAVGKLVLFSADADRVHGAATLRAAAFNKIAIADPKTAPYGAAAVETMKSLGIYDKLLDKIVQGSNIVQAYQFVVTGNAELGFVALSQVVNRHDGSRWLVAADLYAPIRQDAVLLTGAGSNAAAAAFLSFLKNPEAVAVIEKYGYGIK